MRAIRKNFKSGTAILLSCAMIAGLVNVIPDNAVHAQAVGSEPGVSVYATKQQLMDDTFAPDSAGKTDNIGKLVFGKNNDGELQEWYILGKDNGVSGDNTILFAVNEVVTFDFASSTANKNQSLTEGTGLPNTGWIVSANNYGASELRGILQSMATNTGFFTTAEQALMNATTVTTYDVYNCSSYSTTDTLYLPTCESSAGDKLYLVSSDAMNLPMEPYWDGNNPEDDAFYTRCAVRDTSDKVYIMRPGATPSNMMTGVTGSQEYPIKDQCVVTTSCKVRPASNLKLSSVLFTSAASAAATETPVAGTIPSGKAMTLRLDGSSKNIGTVIYNIETGEIKATKVAAGKVAIVVQGNDGANDWYYSKCLTGETTVTLSEIKAELNLSAIDVSACKIWLETTDTDGMIYAVNATEETFTDISSVAITDIDVPKAGSSLDSSAFCTAIGVSSIKVRWTPGDSPADYNTHYTVIVTLTADAGYRFTELTTATVNRNITTDVTKNSDGTLTVAYEFPATETKESVGAPTADPAEGTYRENQLVTLTSSTEGATIYYTTDGTAPSKTNGTEYEAPIALTGYEGTTVTKTINAIAVMDGMDDSQVVTLTYKLEIPASESGSESESESESEEDVYDEDDRNDKKTSNETPAVIPASHWHEDGKGWRYQYPDGTYAAGSWEVNPDNPAEILYERLQWVLLNGVWYSFGADGYMKTGWIYDWDYKGWFYMDVNNGMETGWQFINGKWYYMNPVSDGTRGRMYSNTRTPDGYYVGPDGDWDGQPAQ